MTKPALRLFVVVAAAWWAAPATALAQSVSEGPIIDWLTQKEVSIRKTFDGKSKDESEPAKLSYNSPNSGDPFWLIDLGVKFSEWDVCANCKGKSVILYPILEWHRSTSNLEASHKLKLGPSADFHWGDITAQPVALIMLFKAIYERDVLKNVNSGSFSALAGLMGANKSGGGNTWLPMSHINDRNGNLVFRYAPFAGVERYNNLTIEKKGLPPVPAVSLTALAFHVQADLYPFNTPTSPGWFEIIASVALRHKLSGDDGPEDGLPFASVSGNVYVDAARHFAIGIDYENGHSPKNNFDRQHSTSVGFKAKF